MFFIYLLSFFVIGLLSFFFGHQACDYQSNMWIATLVGQVVFGIATIVISIATIGQQLSLNTDLREYIERCTTEKRKIKLSEEKYEELKVYFEKYMGNDYPQFEKDLLTAISQKPEQVVAIFQTYPQLQASFTMSKLMDQVKEMVSGIYEKRKDLEDTKEHIRILMNSPWLIFKSKINIDEL